MLRWFVIFILIGLAVIAAIGGVLLAYGDRIAGLFLLILDGVIALLVAALSWSATKDIGGGPELTGRVVPRAQPGGAVWSPDRQAWTWKGSGAVSANGYRAHTSWATLELTTNSLTLRLRGGMTPLFGIESPTWQPEDLVTIYPYRGRWFKSNRGLTISTLASRSNFYTSAPEPILAALEERGYPVSWAEHYLRI